MRVDTPLARKMESRLSDPIVDEPAMENDSSREGTSDADQLESASSGSENPQQQSPIKGSGKSNLTDCDNSPSHLKECASGEDSGPVKGTLSSGVKTAGKEVVGDTTPSSQDGATPNGAPLRANAPSGEAGSQPAEIPSVPLSVPGNLVVQSPVALEGAALATYYQRYARWFNREVETTLTSKMSNLDVWAWHDFASHVTEGIELKLGPITEVTGVRFIVRSLMKRLEPGLVRSIVGQVLERNPASVPSALKQIAERLAPMKGSLQALQARLPMKQMEGEDVERYSLRFNGHADTLSSPVWRTWTEEQQREWRYATLTAFSAGLFYDRARLVAEKLDWYVTMPFADFWTSLTAALVRDEKRAEGIAQACALMPGWTAALAASAPAAAAAPVVHQSRINQIAGHGQGPSAPATGPHCYACGGYGHFKSQCANFTCGTAPRGRPSG